MLSGTETFLFMLVDGKVEAVQSGSFSDGRFGVYTCCQSDGPVFSDFEVLPIETLDLTPLVPTGVVDRETGDITITNGTSMRSTLMLTHCLLQAERFALPGRGLRMQRR